VLYHSFVSLNSHNQS